MVKILKQRLKNLLDEVERTQNEMTAEEVLAIWIFIIKDCFSWSANQELSEVVETMTYKDFLKKRELHKRLKLIIDKIEGQAD